MKCVFCEKELEPAFKAGSEFQPLHGGEVKFSFCYGSEFDEHAWESTIYFGVACDQCAKSKMHLLKNGEKVMADIELKSAIEILSRNSIPSTLVDEARKAIEKAIEKDGPRLNDPDGLVS